MSHDTVTRNERPDFDKELKNMVTYVQREDFGSPEAFDTARYCLMDSLGCAFRALKEPECLKLLGPIVPDITVKNGTRVPGTQFYLDPVQGAFNIGTLIRWLDYNDTWLAAEWGHPSDNLGGILAVCDYLSRLNISRGKAPLTMRDVLGAMIKAHEIQGVLALQNSFNRVGLDHVVLVKVATTVVCAKLLGCNEEQILNALSLAWADGQSLRVYRHAPNTGSRKSWAAGDATSRGVRLALMALHGEMGYPSVLTAKTWGFYDVSFKGQPFSVPQAYGSYVMENILFKVKFPAEFHSQTALECALQLHPKIKDKLDSIDRIEISTHESAIRIISKSGPLHNYADRDHCLQYIIAIGLLHGDLRAEHYEDACAKDPKIDILREKMHVTEEAQFSKDYLDPEKRSIANSIQIFFTNGEKTDKITVEYPIGHRRRREESLPFLVKKFEQNTKSHFPKQKTECLVKLCTDKKQFDAMAVNEFMDKLVV